MLSAPWKTPKISNIVVWFEQIGNPVVTVMKNPDFPRADSLVLMPDAGMVCE
jgi:hypothetical protein